MFCFGLEKAFLKWSTCEMFKWFSTLSVSNFYLLSWDLEQQNSPPEYATVCRLKILFQVVFLLQGKNHNMDFMETFSGDFFPLTQSYLHSYSLWLNSWLYSLYHYVTCSIWMYNWILRFLIKLYSIQWYWNCALCWRLDNVRWLFQAVFIILF